MVKLSMRVFNFALLLPALLCGMAGRIQAEQFAPCAPLSPAAHEMYQTTGWNPCQGIPSQKGVGVPAYPGARVSSVSPAGLGLPSVSLLSPEPEAKVQAFYQQALMPGKGWKWNDDLKMFYRGSSEMDALTGQAPSVRIFDVSGEEGTFFLVDKDYRSKVQTKIVIAYSPGNAANTSK